MFKFRKNFFFIFSVVMVVCVLFVFCDNAMAKAKYSWSFAQPWTRPLTNKGYELFCQKVNEYSKGEISIKFFADGLLGTHDESFHAIQEGSVEMGAFSPYVSIVPGGMMNWMPWTIENFEEARIAYAPRKGILYTVGEEAWNEVGGHLLFSVFQGAYGFGSNVRPIRTPDDFSNQKIRVSASLASVNCLRNMGEGTGMTMVTIPWADLYNALSRGVVDGCWSLWPSLKEERHFEVLKYYSDVNWAWDANNVVMNKELWDSLPDHLKEAINKAVDDASEYLITLQQGAQDDFIKFLSDQEGFEIIKLTPEEREVFREKARMSGIWEEICTPWLEKHYPGQNMTAKILDELQRIHEEVLATNKN